MLKECALAEGRQVNVLKIFVVATSKCVEIFCRDDKIGSKCGLDAVHYLTFQRYLILFALLVFVVCILLIFPVNFFASGSSLLPIPFTSLSTSSLMPSCLTFALPLSPFAPYLLLSCLTLLLLTPRWFLTSLATKMLDFSLNVCFVFNLARYRVTGSICTHDCHQRA